jgi:hypothetical protein
MGIPVPEPRMIKFIRNPPSLDIEQLALNIEHWEMTTDQMTTVLLLQGVKNADTAREMPVFQEYLHSL